MCVIIFLQTTQLEKPQLLLFQICPFLPFIVIFPSYLFLCNSCSREHQSKFPVLVDNAVDRTLYR